MPTRLATWFAAACSSQRSNRFQARHRNEGIRLQASRLSGEALPARARQTVAAAQPAIHDLLTVDLDQAVRAKALQSRIQGPGEMISRRASSETMLSSDYG